MMENKPLSIPRNGLVGEWNLDGNALDSNDGTKNNGTATNVTYANTSVGFQKQAGVFNGSSSYVSVPHNSALSMSSEVTITYTKTYDSTQTTYAVDVYKGYDSNGTTRINYAALLNSTGVQFMWYNTTWRVSSSVWFTPVNGTTYHIALKHTSGNGSLTKVYVNGIEYPVTHSGTGNEPLITNSDPLGIGAIIGYSPISVITAKGQIQSVRLYDRALSSQEIQTLYLESKRMIGNSGQPDLFKDCVAYYDFKGDANDVIGGNNGTVNGATLTTDRFGIANSAYSFDGSSDYISVPDNPSFEVSGGSTALSFFAWIYPTDLSGVHILGSKYLAFNVGESEYFFGTAGDKLYCTGQGTNVLVGTVPLSINTWTHVGIIYSGGTCYQYVNGSLANSGSLNLNGGGGSQNFEIGRNGSSSPAYWQGRISDFVFYMGVKTSDEVKALYQASLSQKQYPFTKRLTGSLTQGLMAHIDGSVIGTTAYDQSGNGNNGTLVGSPTVTRGGLGGSKGLQLNGSQGINLGNTQVFSGSAYSISTTYVPLSLPSAGTYDFISSKWGVESSATAGYYFGVNNNGGTIRFALAHFAGGSFTELFWNYPLSVGKKYRITLKWNGSQSELFINGTSLGAQSNSMGCSNSTNNHTIGISSDLSSHGAHGTFANTMINGIAVVNEVVSNDYFATYLQ